MGENEEIMKQIEALKKRMEGKADKGKKLPTKIKVSRVTTEKRDYYEEPKKEVDPVSKFLGSEGTPPDRLPGDQSESAPPDATPGESYGGQQEKKPSKNYVSKKIAANEVHVWLKKGISLFTGNIVGLLVFYFLINLGIALVADIVMFALVGLNAYFLMIFRKKQIYLQRTYNLAVQRTMFSGMKIPKARQWNQRGPGFNENPQQKQYNQNEGDDEPW